MDTNVLELLIREEYIRAIVERCDHIYVTKCVWERETRSVLTHHIHILNSNASMLGRNRKWHTISRINTRPFKRIWQDFLKRFKGGQMR